MSYSVGDILTTHLSGSTDHYTNTWIKFPTNAWIQEFRITDVHVDYSYSSTFIYELTSSYDNSVIVNVTETHLNNNFFGNGDKPFGKLSSINKIVCECGAEVTFGKSVTSLHHSFWCPKRGND